MASLNGDELHVQVVSRRLVKASDTTIEPHVLAVSNLDLLPLPVDGYIICFYRRPRSTDFNAVVTTFESGLPVLLNHFFLLAGRTATNPSSGLPEVHCNNQGAELVVGEAGVALASLDYGNISESLQRIQLPYGRPDLALSVQLVSFACGGFTVAWCFNHVLGDGAAASLLVGAWSELARTGALSAGARPNHDRSVFRPRAPPSYSASLDEGFSLLDHQHQINVLTAEQSFVRRLYYVDASDIVRLREEASRDGNLPRATRMQAISAYLWKALAGVVVGTSETRCRMGWWVNGRARVTEPRLRAALRNYFGNVAAFTDREASVQDVLRMPLPDVAAMVREATTTTASKASYDEHLQELVDWVEEHKNGQRYIEAASIGLGSPALIVTAFASFALDTDFGLGHAAMALSASVVTARLCSGFVRIMPRPGSEGSWIVSAFVWPALASALESDEPRVFRPVTESALACRLLHRFDAAASDKLCARQLLQITSTVAGRTVSPLIT